MTYSVSPPSVLLLLLLFLTFLLFSFFSTCLTSLLIRIWKLLAIYLQVIYPPIFYPTVMHISYLMWVTGNRNSVGTKLIKIIPVNWGATEMLRAGCCSSHQVDVLEGLLSLLFTGPSLATLAEDKMSIKSVRDAKRYG